MVTDTTIAEALRRAIRRRTSAQWGNTCRLAKEMGVEHSYISQICSGRNRPIGLMLSIADHLGIPVEISIDGKPVGL